MNKSLPVLILALIIYVHQGFTQDSYRQLIENAEELKDENPQESDQLVNQILEADSNEVALDIRIKALELKGLGEMYNYQFEASDSYFSRAFNLLNLLDESTSHEIRGSVYLNIGKSLVWQSKFDTALSMMIASKEIYEQTDNLDGLAQTLNAIAIIYIQYSNDATKALESFKRALTLHEASNNEVDAARVMQNIGQIYNMQGSNDSALFYLRKSNRLVNDQKDFRSLAIGYNILGAVFFDLKQLDSSEIYYKQAIALDLVNQDSVGLIYDYSQLATTLVAKFDFGQAEKYSLLAFENTKDIFIKSESAETLANIYEKLGRSGKSLEFYKHFKTFSDSIRSEDQRTTVSELQTKYETAEKEKEIELANAELDKERRFQTFLFIVIGLIVLFSGIAIFLIVQRFKLRRALLSQEIDTLRVQINSLFEGGLKDLKLDLEKINNGLYKPLSEREYEVLNHAISDKNNSEIAEAVYVSVNTVKTHLKNIYSKLGVSNRKEALEVLLRYE